MRYVARDVAFGKLKALAEGAAIIHRELGVNRQEPHLPLLSRFSAKAQDTKVSASFAAPNVVWSLDGETTAPTDGIGEDASPGSAQIRVVSSHEA
jgi:hypothetical protein